MIAGRRANLDIMIIAAGGLSVAGLDQGRKLRDRLLLGSIGFVKHDTFSRKKIKRTSLKKKKKIWSSLNKD